MRGTTVAAGLEDAEVDDREVRQVRAGQRDLVARLDAARDQQVGHHVGEGVDLRRRSAGSRRRRPRCGRGTSQHCPRGGSPGCRGKNVVMGRTLPAARRRSAADGVRRDSDRARATGPRRPPRAPSWARPRSRWRARRRSSVERGRRTPRQVPRSVQRCGRSSSVVAIRGRRPGTVTSTQVWPTRRPGRRRPRPARRLDCHAGRLRGSDQVVEDHLARRRERTIVRTTGR